MKIKQMVCSRQLRSTTNTSTSNI